MCYVNVAARGRELFSLTCLGGVTRSGKAVRPYGYAPPRAHGGEPGGRSPWPCRKHGLTRRPEEAPPPWALWLCTSQAAEAQARSGAARARASPRRAAPAPRFFFFSSFFPFFSHKQSCSCTLK